MQAPDESVQQKRPSIIIDHYEECDWQTEPPAKKTKKNFPGLYRGIVDVVIVKNKAMLG